MTEQELTKLCDKAVDVRPVRIVPSTMVERGCVHKVSNSETYIVSFGLFKVIRERYPHTDDGRSITVYVQD